MLPDNRSIQEASGAQLRNGHAAPNALASPEGSLAHMVQGGEAE